MSLLNHKFGNHISVNTYSLLILYNSKLDKVNILYDKDSVKFVLLIKKSNIYSWLFFSVAIGIISKGGKYSIGTYAHPDIAFEFASWLFLEFKLYLITEFERLKSNEAYQEKIDWQANRLLSKLNYIVHTDSIKTNIVPELTDSQKKFVYAEEADVLNVALFGMTAKEWRENNPKLAKDGNMRDYTDLLHLVILNNLQNTNAELIEEKVPQNERLIKLNKMAKRQMEILKDNKNIKELETLQKQVNDDNLLISDEN